MVFGIFLPISLISVRLESPTSSLLLKTQILKYVSILRFEFFARLEFELSRTNTRLCGRTLISQNVPHRCNQAIEKPEAFPVAGHSLAVGHWQRPDNFTS
jgi:hypothetical protein